MSNAPKVFVSSTVHDFRDLRSAIRYWLEEHGFSVQLSEANDFDIDGSRNSYDACIDAIDRCDYFILLIGARTGGWFDKPNNISITRAEYRRAYERLRNGQLRLVAFVRQDIFTVKEDRNAIERAMLRDHAAVSERASPPPSKFVNDASATFAFIDEVRRVAEMKDALEHGTTRPLANWIYGFNTFEDIVDALTIHLRVAGPLRRNALAANLRHELVENIRNLSEKSLKSGLWVAANGWSAAARARFVGGLDDSSDLPQKAVSRLAMFSLFLEVHTQRISTVFLDEALCSGEFLDFDRATQQHIVGAAQHSLLELRSECERLRWIVRTIPADDRAYLFQLSQRGRGQPDRIVHVDNRRIALFMSAHDRITNLCNLSAHVFHFLAGGREPALRLALCPSSPFPDVEEELKDEQPTFAEVVLWLDSWLSQARQPTTWARTPRGGAETP